MGGEQGRGGEGGYGGTTSGNLTRANMVVARVGLHVPNRHYIFISPLGFKRPACCMDCVEPEIQKPRSLKQNRLHVFQARLASWAENDSIGAIGPF